MESKVVLITGTSAGIGLAIALEYAKNNWRVVATMRDLSKSSLLLDQADSKGISRDNIVIRQLDVTSNDSILKCVSETIEKEGKIHVLVCSAGTEIPASLDELDIEVGKMVMDVNYWGVIRVFQAVYPHMKAAKSGHVQVVSSWAGRFSNFAFYSSYNPTKHALEAAFEGFYGLATLDGVTISMIEPGPVQTDIHGKFIEEREKYFKTEERKQQFLSMLYAFWKGGVTKITQSRESIAQVIVSNATSSSPPFRVPTSAAVEFNIGVFSTDTTGTINTKNAHMGPSTSIPPEELESAEFKEFLKGNWRNDWTTFDADVAAWIQAAKGPQTPEEGK